MKPRTDNEFYAKATYHGPPLETAAESDGTRGNQPVPATEGQMAALKRWLAAQPPKAKSKRDKPDVVANLLRTQRRMERERCKK
jgi:hypothetical protein